MVIKKGSGNYGWKVTKETGEVYEHWYRTSEDRSRAYSSLKTEKYVKTVKPISK